MKDVTIMNGTEWGVGRLDSPEVSVGGQFGAIHFYEAEELVRIVNPATGVDVTVPQELFEEFIDKLDGRGGITILDSIRDAGYEDGKEDNECELPHAEAEG
jgi:hypothetical protein